MTQTQKTILLIKVLMSSHLQVAVLINHKLFTSPQSLYQPIMSHINKIKYAFCIDGKTLSHLKPILVWVLLFWGYFGFGLFGDCRLMYVIKDKFKNVMAKEPSNAFYSQTPQ